LLHEAGCHFEGGLDLLLDDSRHRRSICVIQTRVGPKRSHDAIPESLESLDTCSARYNRKRRHYAVFIGASLLGLFIEAIFRA
jgi:hypothetical protein